jgi:DNA-binding response OmpR family regulator
MGAAVFDVILMDDNMPNMSGKDACKALRSEGYNGLIVGVTGTTYAPEVQKFLDSGANYVFAKPLDISQLRLTVDAFMSFSSCASKH